MLRVQQAFDFLRHNGLKVGGEILINFALPYLIYDLTQPHVGEVKALLWSSGPPILWSAIEFARHRKVDVVSVLALLGIALSLLAFVGTGSVKMIQLREKLVTVLIGAVFVGSALIGRPLIYELAKASLARQKDDEEVARFETLRNDVYFRRSMTIMTLAWGFGLLADAAVSIALVFVVSIKAYLIINPVLGYTTVGLLSLWTFWFARKRRREGEARREAQTLKTDSGSSVEAQA
jgi:hypothetical protein